MKEATLKIVLTIAFVICTYVFISIRFTSPFMFNLTLKEPAIPEHEDFTTYGEHYYKAGLIEHFREDLPQAKEKFRLSNKNSSIREADLLVFGDSHFDFSRQPSFVERIKDSLGLKVFYDRHRKPYNANILAYLNDLGDIADKSKIVIYESSERFVISRSTVEYKDEGIVSKQNPMYEQIKSFRYKIFNPLSNNLYNTFLKKSYLTNYIYTKISTLRFNYFKYINSQIPEYVVNKESGPWLFHYEPVEFFQRTDIEDSLVKHCALNVKKMQQKLKENYNLELIYIIIPEKYSIYNIRYAGKPYHNFIPKMQKEFEKLNIPYIDLYSDFINIEEELYYKTDTHWNVLGVDIAVENTLEFMRERSRKPKSMQ